MGEIADMMIEGILCQSCGVYIDDEMNEGDEGPGFARFCPDCDEGDDE